MPEESFVVDANIINALEKSEAGLAFSTSDDPQAVMSHLAESGSRVLLDLEGHVEHEWRNCVSDDWFENWYVAIAMTMNIAAIPSRRDRALEQQLHNACGFPRRENIWLIRTALGEVSTTGACNLLTEDVDFFEPRAKRAGANRRNQFLHGSKSGPVDSALRSKSVTVLSLRMY